MGEIAVHADGDYVDSQFLEFRVFDGNCRQLRRSDAGKIGRVKAQHYPLAPEICQFNIPGGTFVIRPGGKIRRLSAYLYIHFRYLLAVLWE
jgi:hypothetical protein